MTVPLTPADLDALTAALGKEPTMPTGQEKEVATLRMAFGLRAQGHLPTVETMLAEGCAWDEIGIAIGWCPKTAAEYYGRERKEPIPTTPTGQEKSL